MITTLNVGCAKDLPAGFPRPPSITLCTNVIIKEIFDEKGQPLTLPKAFNKEGQALPVVATYWACERSDSRERSSQLPNFVQIGTPIGDWNKGQSFRRAAESWVKVNCQ